MKVLCIILKLFICQGLIITVTHGSFSRIVISKVFGNHILDIAGDRFFAKILKWQECIWESEDFLCVKTSHKQTL